MIAAKNQYLKTYLAIKILRGTRSVLTVFFYCSCVVAFEVSFVIEAVHVSENTGLQRFTLQKIQGIDLGNATELPQYSIIVQSALRDVTAYVSN